MTEPELFVVADAGVAAASAAERIAATLATASATRGRVDWAVTGGSTAAAIYRHIVDEPHPEPVPWRAVHVWWGDDRFVPRDHPLSNVKPFDDILLGLGLAEEGLAGGPAGVPIPLDQLHPFRTSEAIGRSHEASWCAAALADELNADGPPSDANGWPTFDLVTLGMGADGHILSVFPGSPALGSTDLALAIPAPTHIEPRVERLTLNPAVVTSARHVLVVVVGADKAATVADVFGPERDARRWPAQLARHDRATWILDAAAAGDLPDR